MPYVPVNLSIYINAFSGAIAGILCSNRQPTDPNAADYALIQTVAGAFAQQMDQSFHAAEPGLPSDLDVTSIQVQAMAVWLNRFPTNDPKDQDPLTYKIICDALAAMAVAGDTFFSGQGIPVVYPPIDIYPLFNPISQGISTFSPIPPPPIGFGGNSGKTFHEVFLKQTPDATVDTILATIPLPQHAATDLNVEITEWDPATGESFMVKISQGWTQIGVAAPVAVGTNNSSDARTTAGAAGWNSAGAHPPSLALDGGGTHMLILGTGEAAAKNWKVLAQWGEVQ